MNEYKINTKSEIKRTEKKKNNRVKQVIIFLITLILIAIIEIIQITYSIKVILEKQQRIDALQNKVYQQIELIDALQQ